MRIPSLTRRLLICALAAGVAGVASGAGAGARPGIDLSWLEGCWAHEDGGTKEYWIDTGHGLLFGHSVTIRENRLAAFEDLRIEPGAAGPVYVASPGGRTPVVFQYADSGASSVVFENPDHDFPQQIAYTRTGDRLTASISTLDRLQEIDIAMTVCAGVASGLRSDPSPTP